VFLTLVCWGEKKEETFLTDWQDGGEKGGRGKSPPHKSTKNISGRRDLSPSKKSPNAMRKK